MLMVCLIYFDYQTFLPFQERALFWEFQGFQGIPIYFYHIYIIGSPEIALLVAVENNR